MNKLFLVLLSMSCFCIVQGMDKSFKFLDIETHQTVLIDSAQPRPKNTLKQELASMDRMSFGLSEEDSSKLFFIEHSGTQTGFCCLAKDAVKIPKLKQLIEANIYSYAMQNCTDTLYKRVLCYIQYRTQLTEDKNPSTHPLLRKNLNDIVDWAERNSCLSLMQAKIADLYHTMSKEDIQNELLSYKQQKSSEVFKLAKEQRDLAGTEFSADEGKQGPNTKTKDQKKSDTARSSESNSGYLKCFIQHPYLTASSIAILLGALSLWYFKSNSIFR